MPDDEEVGALSPQVTAALEDLRKRLTRPETVRLALKQYVVSEIVKALMDLDDQGPALSLTATSVETSNTENDDGTATHCHTESYSLLGHEVYSHVVCDTVSSTGGGSAEVHF